MYKGLVKFKEHVVTQTKGDIKVEIYSDSQLGDDKKILDSFKAGTSKLTVPNPAALGASIKEFNILNLPFLFPDEEVAEMVMDGETGKEFTAILNS